jgi:hypothetical protein
MIDGVNNSKRQAKMIDFIDVGAVGGRDELSWKFRWGGAEYKWERRRFLQEWREDPKLVQWRRGQIKR